LGQIDQAAEFATSARRKWQLEGHSARDSVEADIALATLHVQTGSSEGPAMAHAAIRTVSQLSSVRARRVKLPPLLAALSKRGNQTEPRFAAEDGRGLSHRGDMDEQGQTVGSIGHAVSGPRGPDRGCTGPFAWEGNWVV
jgi:hypothetical protein